MTFSSVVGWKAHLNTDYVAEQSYTTHNQIGLTGRGEFWCFYKSTKIRITELLRLRKTTKITMSSNW